MDFSGRVVLIRKDIHSSELSIDLGVLSSGVYTLILSGKNQFRGKLAVK